MLGTSLAHAATLNFNGGNVAGCTINGAQYTCASLALGSTDVIVIGSAYAVTVNSSLAMSYNQGLTMSGNAALTIKGNLDIKDIKPSNLNVTGGNLTAEGGTFLMGAQEQTITANISATTIKMGSNNVTVTGKISAKGPVEIASGSVINGPISGTVVTILPASTRIQGDITATTSLTIGSGSQVTGNLKSPTIDLKASGLLVTGDVEASNSLSIASGNGIKGNVDAGEVTLDSSNAYITGNAKVDHITLGWQGRVQQTITCKAYTPSNPCSCVTNNSGWAFNEPMGPKCGPSTPSGLHHFQIDHPLTALTCQVPTVKVTACADASCSAVYKGSPSPSVTVSPGGVPTQIDTSGVNANVAVRQTTVGIATLSLVSTPATTGALVCKSGGNTSNCQISFLSSGFQVSGIPRYAEEAGELEISALQTSSGNRDVCVPMFGGQKKDLTLSCAYSNPDKGTLPARIFDSATNSYVALAANDQSSCAGSSTKVTVTFGANGVAKPNMLYADAGALILTAAYNPKSGSDSGLDMSGSGTVIVAPAKFLFTRLAPTQRAGLPAATLTPGATITLSAVNALGAVTKNFGNESGVAVQKVVLNRILLAPLYTGVANPEVGGDLDFVKKGGVITAPPLVWPEVGKINFTAALQNGYLGSSLTSPGASDPVLFYPHHFVTELVIKQVDLPGGAKTEFPFPCSAPLACSGNRAVYSRQPFDLTIRAQNSGGVDTKNFDARNDDINKTQVTLLPYDAATGKNSYPPTAPSGSTLTDGAKAPAAVTGVPVTSFSNGVATRPIAYSFPAAYAVPKETKALASPTGLLLRATYAYPAAGNVSSAPADGQEAQLTVLTGRLMVPHDYGSERYPVRLAVQTQYWDGKTWVTSLLDSISAFDNTLVVFANCKKTLVCKDFAFPAGTTITYTVDKGVLPLNKRLTLAAPGAGKTGSVDVSVPGIAYLPSTVGTVVFGVFKSGPVIYLREMY
ncbi:polymer-forming cytoskeletal protein [Janthinobacterium sp. FW305-129]|uniref:polymer-forming cytoskeletal protein n=1 Tax=Janthinobacterium sp. FW305-129 TaxID=2775054 RepID=UPI001E58D597|nr:polymer-forming cytoskeletal protein [Janthinobacterium sp. FW305-129]MCC7599931.1 polymer-forming cytoskeletal protein [Janthinobacterium sp. FW305-129]